MIELADLVGSTWIFIAPPFIHLVTGHGQYVSTRVKSKLFFTRHLSHSYSLSMIDYSYRHCFLHGSVRWKRTHEQLDPMTPLNSTLSRLRSLDGWLTLSLSLSLVIHRLVFVFVSESLYRRETKLTIILPNKNWDIPNLLRKRGKTEKNFHIFWWKPKNIEKRHASISK